MRKKKKMTGYLLDTSFVVWHLHGIEVERMLLQMLKEKGLPHVSALSFFEVAAQEKSLDGKAERIRFFLKMFNVCNVNADVASLAGKLLKKYKHLDFCKACIAATCLHHDFVLVTRHPERYFVDGLKCFVFEEMKGRSDGQKIL